MVLIINEKEKRNDFEDYFKYHIHLKKEIKDKYKAQFAIVWQDAQSLSKTKKISQFRLNKTHKLH